MTYFISDLHFGHKNCLVFDKRPYDTIEEHDEDLINRWNEVVGVDDDVWILGDVSWHSSTKTIEIFKRLNGVKHLCAGNHDKKLLRNQSFQNLFVEIVNYKEIEFDDGSGVVLCHYPIPCYNRHHRGWYHLYGHVHKSFEWDMLKHFQSEMREKYSVKSRMYNTGCMVSYMDYKPRTLTEIVEGGEQCEVLCSC